jgi:hypothetical protein
MKKFDTEEQTKCSRPGELAPSIRAPLPIKCNITLYSCEYSVLGKIFVSEIQKSKREIEKAHIELHNLLSPTNIIRLIKNEG